MRKWAKNLRKMETKHDAKILETAQENTTERANNLDNHQQEQHDIAQQTHLPHTTKQ